MSLQERAKEKYPIYDEPYYANYDAYLKYKLIAEAKREAYIAGATDAGTIKDSVKFAEWLMDCPEEINPFVRHNGRWMQMAGNSSSWTTEQLYEIFLKESKK